MPGILDFLQGQNQSIQNIPRFSPEQMQFQNQALQLAQQGLGTDAIENRARAGFQRQTIPLLSTRFAAANAGGTSGYQNALQSAGSELELGLAAQRQQNAMNLANIGLTPQFEQVLERGQPMGLGQSLLSGLAGSAPQLAELGIRGLSSYFKPSGQQIQTQAPGTGSTIGNIAGTAASLAPTIAAGSSMLGGLSGLGSTIGGGLAAAAPFALPVAGAAAVIALPFILSKLLED